MSEFFAEATVRLTPDLTGFVTQLRTDVKAAVERVEGTPAARVRIAPALTRDFVGSLRKQVNLAVAQAQRGVKPIQVRAVLSDVSRAAIAREIRTGAQTVGAGTRGRGPAPAVSAAVASTRDLATAGLGLVDVEKLLAQAHAARIPLLGALSAQESSLTKARELGAKASVASGAALNAESQAAHTLAAAKAELAAAEQNAIGTSARATAIRNADRLAVKAFVQAQGEANLSIQQAATSFRGQIRALEGASGALNETSRAARQAASNMSQLRRGVLSTSLSFLGIRGATLAASARFLIAAAAVATFAKAVTSAAETATQLNVFRATTSSTADEMERVGDLARELGADLSLPGVTALDAAEAMTELAKAGLSTQDAMDGARGVLQLATAAAIDNAQATELAANAINAFGLAGRQATQVADTFANAANAAQGSIVDIGIAFQQASAAGRQVGLSFQDTTTFLTILARNGLRGSDAGTSLRTALIRLIKPSKDAAAELKRLGIETRDAAGNLRPDIFIQISEALRNVSPAVRDSTIALIGGQDAFRAITILGRQSIGEFIRLRRELRQQGTAAELAEARMTGLRGALEGLGNTLSSIGLRAGERLTPALEGVVQGITGAATGLAASDAAAQTFGGTVDALEISLSALSQTLGAIAAVVAPVAGGLAAVANSVGVPTILAAAVAYKVLPALFLRIRAAATVATVAMSLMALQGVNPLRAGITAAAGAFNIWAVAATAVAAGLFYLITAESSAERATRRLTEATEDLVSAQERAASTRTESRSAGLSVNAAELGVLEAQAAASRARAELGASTAAKGTFARRKAEFELAVALDNVVIAQDAVSAAIERANAASDEAAQAAVNAEAAAQKEIDSLVALTEVRAGLTSVPGRGGQAALQAQQRKQIETTTEAILDQAAAQREEGSAASIALARRIELLATLSAAVGELPTERTIDIAINTPNIKGVLEQLNFEFGTSMEQLKEQLFSTLTTLGTSPEVTAAALDLAKALGIELTREMPGEGRLGGSALVHGIVEKIDEDTVLAVAAVDRLMQAIKNSLGRSAALDVQGDLATIASGATGARLPSLQADLAEAQGRERRARAAIAASPVGETHNMRIALRTAIRDQARIITEIRSINSTLASEAKSAADDAKSKQDQIFSDILEAMGVKRDNRQQAIENAQLTEGAADDLAATRKLRQLAKRQINTLKVRIAAAIVEGKNVKVLIDGLAALKDLWRDLGREVISLQKTKEEERQARISESISLDIEFAQITENRNAEIRARLREIARLKKLQSAVKNDIVERKRLRNLIAEQEKAIDELRKQNDDRNKAFQELSFSFLTTQQGFAANLLGNLLPMGAIGGTVAGNLASRGGGGGGGGGAGGGAASMAAVGRPNDFLQQAREEGGGMGLDIGLDLGGGGGGAFGGVAGAAAAAEAGTIAPPTRGQVSTTNDLLRHILRALRHQAERTKHPSSKKSQAKNAAVQDGIGGV